jgi:hypothetical protein
VYNIHAERSAGWSGLAFLATVIVASLLYGGAPPPINSSAATIAAFLNAHHQIALVGNWLSVPASVFFLWFAVGVRAHLVRAPGSADGLPLYAISGAIVSVASALMSAAVLGVLLLTAVPVDDLPGWWGFYMLLGGPILMAGTAVFVYAAANSMRRHGSASQGLAMYGYLAAFGAAVSTLSLFFAAGPMSATGWVPIVLGLGLFAIWVIATSIWLIRSSGEPAAVS